MPKQSYTQSRNKHGSTWWTTGQTLDTYHMLKLYHKASNVVSLPYSRYRLVQEWHEDTAPDDEEPNGPMVWVVHLDRYTTRSYQLSLTWERWVEATCLDDDVQACLRELRSLTEMSYHLLDKPNCLNVLVFRSRDAAVKVAERVAQAMGSKSFT